MKRGTSFFKAGQRDLCIDGQTFPCGCHPNTVTVGRRTNHSTKNANLKPLQCLLKVDGEDVDVVLFKALQDIKTQNIASVPRRIKFLKWKHLTPSSRTSQPIPCI